MDRAQILPWSAPVLSLLRRGLSGLPEALGALAEALEAHRAYLFRLEEREGRWYTSQLAEWAGPGVTPQIQNPSLQNVPMREAGYGRWLEAFLRDQAIGGPVRSFPEEERPLLQAQEIQSLLAVPIWVESRPWGFLGVDDCERERAFTPEEEGLLRGVAEVLARTLELFEVHRFTERLLEISPFYVARLDPEGRLLWTNAAFKGAFPQRVPFPLEEALAQPGRPIMATTSGEAPAEWTLLAVPGPGGEALEILALGLDLRERLRAQDQEARWSAFRKNLLRVYETLMAEGFSDSVFSLILEAALDTVPAAQAGSVTVLKEDGYYHFVAAKGYDLEALRQIRLHPEEPLSLTGHKEAQVFTQGDLERFNQGLDPKRKEVMEGARRVREIRAVLAVPVYLSGERKAFLYLDNLEREDAFAPLDLELAQAFASQLGLLLRRLELEGRLTHLAYHDPLTGLPNRLFFLEKLAQALKEDPRLAVLYLDLDGLKLVNDLEGHALGDEVIRAIGARLRAALRPRDLVARQGGDEFLVLLTGIRRAEEAIQVAERLLEVVRLPLPLGERVYRLTTSIGIALGEGGLSPGELLQRADLALYRAKGEGKDRLAFYEPKFQEALRREMALVEALREALAREEEGLTLFYQPLVDLGTGRPVALEALIRWPEASPKEFIPIAERHRLMPELGAWVLRRACREHSRHGLPVHVNVSPQELLHPSYPSLVAQALEEADCPPEALVLEVTETALIPDERGRDATETVRALRRLGVRVFLDDFGTGYSSLERLAALPVDGLKLGQAFTKALGSPPDPQSPPARLVAAVLALAQALGLAAVAEGIEDEATLAYLRGLGFTLGQGYLLGRPKPLGYRGGQG
ncbi:bifunctional diguanylate cyclase/phosphodiesterase [Thermus sediminis]|uniref:bifunctional diguanylate cyclase/phosphodiesterase n=1 Tax=Thermus sediminis TaxID=1761908 RepID=UPI000E3B8D69|nr:EAL domain-containing protein [Thermus sediminis]